MNLTDEAKSRGYAVLANTALLVISRLWLAKMLQREFNISYSRSLRWTSIGGWTIYLVARNWHTGIIAGQKTNKISEEFVLDLKKASE